MLPFLWLLFGALVAPVLALNILTSPADLKHTEYDYVVVGGGTAGLAIATRLSEDPSVKVLVVEAGGSNQGVLASIVPFLAVTLPGTQLDWNFTTTPQAGFLNRSITFARGHVLGGSSSINIMAYYRASNDTWDNFARLTGDDGWAWKNVEQFYLRNSRLVPSADGHNTTGQVDPAVHGNGPVQVSVFGFPTDVDSLAIEASKLLGGRFAFNEDHNGGKTVGFGYSQSSVGNSRRSSSAVAYLDSILFRQNLFVLINTQATKLIQSQRLPRDKSSSPAFRTLEIAQGPNAPCFQVHATKEIILSAGSIGTPRLLLLSGIGEKSTLEGLGIQTVVDLPDVGQHLADQPLVPLYFFVNSTKTNDAILRNNTLFGLDLELWNLTGQGPFVDTASNTVGYMRLPENSTIFQTVEDPSSGNLSAHTEILFVNGFAPFGGTPLPTTGNFLTVLTSVVSTTSRGSITIPSSDPFAAPVINPNYLTSAFDTFAMVQVMKDAQQFVTSPPWKGFTLGPFGTLANATTDEDLLTYARTFSVTINHSVGTAMMSPVGADFGVVDPDLLVKGANGLRIADSSVFPKIPECHTQAPTYIVAERAVDLIRNTYNRPPGSHH